jgi:outer membrane lipoprotein SlyB
MNTIRMIAATILMLGMGTALANDANAECHDVVVYKERPSDDQHHVVGTAIGAVAGAVIGHGIGGSRLATVGGAVAGGAIGHHVAKDEAHHKYRTVEHVCTPAS